MKKLSRIVLALSIAFTIIGCNEQVIEKVESKEPEAYSTERSQELAQMALMGNYKISEENAAEALLYFLVSKDSENGRAASTNAYELEKINTATIEFAEISNSVNSTSRNSSVEEYDDIDFYLYQINNSVTDTSGYAVLSNDKRIGEIISVVDDSEFSEDISDNPFMQLFCMGLEDYLEETSDIWNSLTDDDLDIAAERAAIDPVKIVDEGGWSFIEWKRNKGNIKYELKTNWNQNDSPYNNCIVSIIGGNSRYAGCGAVAVAQIMAFHEWPKNCTSANYNRIKSKWNPARNWNGTYNWSLLKSVGSPASYISNPSELQMQIGALMFDVAEGCNSSYYSNSTTVTPSNCMNFLVSSGYMYDASLEYNYNTIQNSIDNGRPVILYGYSRKEWKTITYKVLWWSWTKKELLNDGGHYFIADGYYNMSCTAVKGNERASFTYDFVHCNAGLGGHANGYYLTNVFNMKDRHLIGDDDYINQHLARSEEVDYGEKNYRIDVRQITNIKRR